MNSLRRFNFTPIGGWDRASSRLRAWMLARQLNRSGCEATVNGDATADVEVFQKRIDFGRLREARHNGALVVFDFDDNILLEDFGRKVDYLAFGNAADVITVGSRTLLGIAAAYHDRVFLFENPLDVLPASDMKRHYEWQGRLGWFGNPSGLVALEDTGLRGATVAVTRQGDIPWSLETIDETVRSFDLVLIPVRADAWTDAKNAHRLLKCVALGVPFLASRTPAHEDAVREMGLPEWLLVEDGQDWQERVAVVRRRYVELPAALAQAARTAWERYGVEPVADRWLNDLAGAARSGRRPLDLAPRVRAQLRGVDVLVLNENEPDLATRTLESLRLDEVDYRSVRLVSALPVDLTGQSTVEVLDDRDDFFEIYSSVVEAASTCSGTGLLFVRAGVELTRGFFEELSHVDSTDCVQLFALQRAAPDFTLLLDPPTRLDQLLEVPYIPSLYLCPAPLIRAHGGLRAIFGPLASWDLLIGVTSGHGARLAHVSAPVAWIDARTEDRTAMDSYRIHLARLDLPRPHRSRAGWHQLLFVWQSAVIESHRAVFGRYVSTIVPELTRRYNGLDEANEDLVPVSVGGRWLTRLSAGPGPAVDEPLRLVRREPGGVYLMDGGRCREVGSDLLVVALERAFGPATLVGDADIAGWEPGPPVVVFANEAHEHFLVAGDRRFLVRGLLLPWQVSSTDLVPFDLSETVLDVTER